MRSLALAISLGFSLIIGGAAHAQFGPAVYVAQAAGGGGGGGSYVFIPSAKGASVDNNNVTTASFDSTGGDLIVCADSSYAPGTAPTGVSDSKGNTYTGLTSRTAGSQTIRIWYKQSPSVGSGHTVSTTGGSGVYNAMSCAVFSGSIASPFDVEATANCGSCTTVSGGSVTPSVTAELMITGISFSDAGTMSIGSSFTIPTNGQVNFVGGTNEGVALAYKIKTDAAAENPTWTSTVTQAQTITAMGTFKP